MKVALTPYELAQRFVGLRELPGALDSPLVLAMLRLDQSWPERDEVPWCSAYVNFVCWLLHLPRSKSLAARSWLDVGVPVALSEARADADVVVFDRATPPNMNTSVRDAPGHVGFYAGQDGDGITVLGGNQSNQVCLATYSSGRLLGVRRLN